MYPSESRLNTDNNNKLYNNNNTLVHLMNLQKNIYGYCHQVFHCNLIIFSSLFTCFSSFFLKKKNVFIYSLTIIIIIIIMFVCVLLFFLLFTFIKTKKREKAMLIFLIFSFNMRSCIVIYYAAPLSNDYNTKRQENI